MSKKPKFNPNAPFEVVQETVAKKPAFDPNQPFEVVDEPQEVGPVADSSMRTSDALGGAVQEAQAEDVGFLGRLKGLFSKEGRQKIAQQTEPVVQEAFNESKRRSQAELEHFANQATLNYLPQLQAVAQKPIFAAGNLITGKSVEPDSYVDARDANINRMDQQAEEFPYTTTKAGLLGVGANALATPGMGLAKTFLGGVGKATAFGAGQGFLQNPGDTEGEVAPVQLAERLDNAERGAKVGLGVGLGAGVAQKIAGRISRTGDATKSAAEATAFKGSGAMLKDFRAAAPKGEAEKIGRFMLDEKIIQAGDTVEDVANKAIKFKDASGKELDDVYTQAAKALENPEVAAKMPGFNPVRDRAELVKRVEQALGDAEDAAPAVKRFTRYIDTLAKKYGDNVMPPRAANDIKGAMDDAINYSRNPLNKKPGVEKAYSEGRKWLAEKVDAGVEYLGKASGQPELANRLRTANKNYGASSTVSRMAKDRVQRESANQTMGLTDRIAAGAGAGVGGVAAMASGDRNPLEIGIKGLGLGLLTAAGSKGLKTYGTGVLASGLNKATPVMNVVGAGGTTAQGLLSRPDILARLSVAERKKLKKKKGLLNDQQIELTEGYEQ